MANHRATGRAHIRPLHSAQGARRNTQAATASVVKVGVIGALATATIAVPLASAAADQGTALPSSIEASGEQATPTPQTVQTTAESKVEVAQEIPQAVETAVVVDPAGYADGAAPVAVKAIEARNADGKQVEIPANGDWQQPTPGAPVTSPFGYRMHPVLGYVRMHNGVDFGAACGTPALSANSGTVAFAGQMSGAGNAIIIDHGNGTRTHYYHLSVEEVHVGQTVTKGQEVGKVGSTGVSSGCHLHFGLEQNGGFVDPLSLWK